MIPIPVTHDILDGGHGTITVLARISLLSTESGGRRTPISGSYRPCHNFGDEKNLSFYVGQLLFKEGERLGPGETTDVPVKFVDARGLRDFLTVGRKWRLQEAIYLVGFAEVLKIVNEDA